MPLIIDASGKTVDASGQEIQLITHVPTLKANLRAQEKKTDFVKVNHHIIKASRTRYPYTVVCKFSLFPCELGIWNYSNCSLHALW